ncbi:MAG: amidase [Alphaproteobacteria bacterium]|nr:amidase [Alphaproteobacteria bacterium]
MSDPFAPIHELAPEIAAGRLSPVEVTEACLDRIATLDPDLTAFAAVYAEEAGAAAEAAHRVIRAGHRIGPLHGIPIGVKDLCDIEGRITTGGAAIWKERRSPTTATLVERLRAAGMIIIGKTHTVEFAYGGWGTNNSLGTPRNPWDRKTHRIPGGSSSGTGAAVGAGLIPCGIGTDTGGSVRLPAAFCGTAGLKTSVGRISTHGVLPLSHTLDTPGPLARAVEDCAWLLEAMQGPDPRDRKTRRLAPADATSGLRRGVHGLCLARLPDAERAAFDAEVLAAYDASLAVLEDLGAHIMDIDMPRAIADFAPLVATIIGAESYTHLKEVVDDENQPLDPDIRPRVAAGGQLSAHDYVAALLDREDVMAAFDDAMDGIDALLTPTACFAAIPVAAVNQETTPATVTRMGNYLGLTGLALRNGFTRTGLPTSLLVNARDGDEALALRIGWAYEQATDWHRRIPEGY